MSINVVVSSTAAGVSVSGGAAIGVNVSGDTAAGAVVSGGTAVSISIGGGIGPAGFIAAPGTSTNAFGTFQLTAGDGITISTSAAQFQIASYGTAVVAAISPVQSVAGRTGAISLTSADVSGLASIATSGSYTSLSNIPSTFSPTSHTHTASQIGDFAAEAAKYGPVVSVNGQTGAVTISSSEPSVSLSDSTPSALGTAAAGTSSLAARSDHVHTLPTASALGLAAVATSGKYSDLTGTPAAYSLPTASDTVLGAIKVGSGLSIAGGVLSATGGGGSGILANDTVDGGDYVGVIASLSFSQQPADASISIDQGSTGSASFTVAASASTGAAVAYQWQVNTGIAWATVDGATSSTLSLTGLTGTDDGNLYRCVASAYGLPITASDSATLSVAVIVPSAPVISVSTQPQNATIQNTSSTASFSVTASVTSGTLAYQWQRRASGSTTWTNITGGTSSTLSLTGLTYTANQGDSYRCRLTASGASTVITSTATLAITWVTAPQISIVNGPSTINWPAQNNFCVVTYGETLLGSPTSVSRQWQALNSSGAFVPVNQILPSSQLPYGSTTRDLTLYQTTRAITVQCVIVATNAYGTATATTAQVVVNPAPIV